MGCAQTRDQTEEQEIEDREKDLGFHKFTISQIKQAFFIPSGPESINLNQLQKAIDDLELNYNEVELESYTMFISGFLIDPKEEVKHYNLKTLLLAIFLLSKSSQKEKASALFDIYDENCDRKLTRDQIKAMLISVIEVVFSYSEKLLDNDEGMIQMHHEIVNAKEEELMGKLFGEEFEKMKIFKKDEFCQWIATTAPKFVDFTSPKNIREVVMDFVLHTKKTQVELQQIYKLGIKRSGTMQKQDSDLTNDNTPSASGYKEVKILTKIFYTN